MRCLEFVGHFGHGVCRTANADKVIPCFLGCATNGVPRLLSVAKVGGQFGQAFIDRIVIRLLRECARFCCTALIFQCLDLLVHAQREVVHGLVELDTGLHRLFAQLFKLLNGVFYLNVGNLLELRGSGRELLHVVEVGFA